MVEFPSKGVLEKPTDWDALRQLLNSGEIQEIELADYLLGKDYNLYWRDICDLVLENGALSPISIVLINYIEDPCWGIIQELRDHFPENDLGFLIKELVGKGMEISWSQLKPYVYAIGVSQKVFDALEESLEWEDVKSFFDDPEISLEIITGMFRRLSKKGIECFFENVLDENAKRFLQELEVVEEDKRCENIDQVNRFQEDTIMKEWEGFENMMPKLYINGCKKMGGQRILNFYIRPRNMSLHYKVLVEFLFYVTQKYLDRSSLFSSVQVLPRNSDDEFAAFIDEEVIRREEGDLFKRNSVCNANTIHFSHGFSGEGPSGSRPLICDAIINDDGVSGAKNKNKEFSRLDISDPGIPIDLRTAMSSAVIVFFKNLRKFEEEILKEAERGNS